MLQLTARTGNDKGISWVINTEARVLGRDLMCDIVVNDPIVSRRHCEVRLEEGHAWVEDLGSSNATFVNSQPIKRAQLKPGDEIAIGSSIFMVTVVRTEERDTATHTEMSANNTFRTGEPMILDRDSESLFDQGKPRTVEDLAMLFNLGRAFSRGSRVAELVAPLAQCLRERFNPEAYWVILRQEEEESPAIYPVDEAGAFTSNRGLAEIVHQVLQEPKGMLLPERWTHDGMMGIRTTLVAPMALGKEVVGVIVAQADTPKLIFDDTDLEFLLAVAHAAAPYLKAVERLEQLERENQRLLSGTPNAGPILGTGRAITRVRSLARMSARSDLNVLILGETGTGKELVARMIHDLSERAGKPLTIVNCAAIPDELFESELFGHERGAFTGAHAIKVGLFEESDSGTLFLDEVGDLSLHNQARLLRAIETGTFRRLGGRTDLRVNVRVLSATNKDIAKEVEGGRFRRDLYHRLNAFEIQIPPLRERRADIPVIADHFLTEARARFRCLVEGFEPATIKALQDRPWPGNVRELRNVIERAAVVAKRQSVRPEDLVMERNYAPGDTPFLSLEELERDHIIHALQLSKGNIPAAAELLKIGRSTLYRKVTEYGLPT